MVKQIKILIAHSDSEIVKMITAITRRENFLVTVAAGGVDAIQKIGREKYDLVISGLTLAGSTGSEVACRMRGSELNAGTSFTLLTGAVNPKLIGDLFGLRKIDSYVPMPISFAQLSAHIHMMVNTKKRRHAAAVKAVAPVTKI